MVFNSRAELIEWTRATGKRFGFVIVIRKSEVNVSRRKPRIRFACERSGTYKHKISECQGKKRSRATGTKKCNCPFLLKGKKLASDDNWALKVINGQYNHPAAQHLEGHSFASRLTKEEVNMLIDMSKSEVKPKNILHTLQNRDIHNVSTMKTIYNARYKYKVFMVPGSSMPPIAVNWLEYHHSCARGWETPYTNNIDAFKDLVFDVMTRETIDLNG
ncbi:hypothetical protein Dsin_006623 [Dipteronia sinensis]|uniref:FAR1 domain-containing protein n=1 Tax=Dipteronia sinensis TaxID=43782 RepID=A0AAE0EFT5_9ROSI|nr:hypothetical protein Dsin_006623 [Dipteronia sinensis]